MIRGGQERQSPSEGLRCHQRSSEAHHELVGHAMLEIIHQSMAINGNQWQSMAINGNQWQSEAHHELVGHAMLEIIHHTRYAVELHAQLHL